MMMPTPDGKVAHGNKKLIAVRHSSAMLMMVSVVEAGPGGNARLNSAVSAITRNGNVRTNMSLSRKAKCDGGPSRETYCDSSIQCPDLRSRPLGVEPDETR